ncbi:restriction endonuclease subunit S [Deinococcus psychrotolerans]|nr:restriction endonuclease subunit S [Deinococcus psychrotolerans]
MTVVDEPSKNDTEQLPVGWVRTTLGNVGVVSSGGTPPAADESNFGGAIPWITPADLTGYKEKFITGGRRNLSEQGYKASSATIVDTGSVLFSSRAPIGYVALARNPISTNQGFKNLTPYSGISSDYLYHYLKSAKQLAQSYASGTTFLELSGAKFASLPLPLPPLPEQRRIVTKIEELFSKLDAGVAELKRTQVLLKRYRQSLLHAAVTGQLSRTWRETQTGELEDAGELLARILDERRAKWKASGKKGKYVEPKGPDVSGLPELPQGWVWTNLGQTFEVGVGATPSRAQSHFWGGNIPWVSSGEVAFCNIKKTRETITEAGYAASSTKLHPIGTVLIGMIGEGKTRGQVAILNIEACNNQNSAAIRVSETPILPEYIYYFLTSQYEESRRAASGGNQLALNKSRVEVMKYPLPPLSEQAQIVTEVERRLSILDNMQATVSAELRRAESTRQSILHRAFSGQLVPQDSSDEPASILLERIKAEKVAAGTAAIRGQGKRGRKPKGAANQETLLASGAEN